MLDLGKDEEVDVASEGVADLRSIVAALVTVGRGEPREIVRQAWEVRKQTTKLRGIFSKLEQRGDAMVLEATQLAGDYNEIVAALVGRKPKPRLARAFERVSITLGIPTFSFNTAELMDWVRFKRRAGHVRSYARLLYDSASGDLDTSYATLIERAFRKSR